MNDREQAYGMLKDLCRARVTAPSAAMVLEDLAERHDSWQGPRRCVQRLGGMAGVWPEAFESRFSWEREQ